MNRLSLHIALAIGALVACSPGIAGVAYPTKGMPAALDVGALRDSAEISVTLSLKLRNEAAADSLVQAVSDKTSPQYHQFLTPAQFKAQFAQSDADVATVVAHLAADGLTATRSGASTLRVTGSPASMERVFHVTLHQYAVPAHDGVQSVQFHAPTSAPTIPSEIASVVDGVVGLSSRPSVAPHNKKGIATLRGSRIAHATANSSGLINPLGSLTVADFAKYYDVLPLTAKKINGEGKTLAIVTFASFTPSDAFAYWKSVGLKVQSDRIKIVNVDGGPGAPSDEAGSDETTLDVEQSGGIAPASKIIVYQGPNTDQAFIDTFVAAIEGNKAESISTSWGLWEWYSNLANGAVSDPYTGKTVSGLKALHEILLQAALQGQSVFAAAGDAGAYDANDGQTPPDYSLALSVDNPASDTYITAAGGTTLAGQQIFSIPGGQMIVLKIAHERIWSWDYLEQLCADLGVDNIECGIFPVGGGGGVSFEFPVPFYQSGLPGIQKTQPDQAFVDEDTIPPQTLVAIPSHYAGRNVPDVSFNADPDTGYVLYYTSSEFGFQIETFFGGTSFVAPQLNGVTALLGQYVKGRLGLLNIPLYEIAKSGKAYEGKGAPFHAIKYGNNDFYTGSGGYNPGAGIGTIDVTNLADALKAAY